MSKTLRYFFTLVILTASALSTQAQDCGCDHVINPPQDRATSLILDGETMGVKPGETVCLSAGFYMQIRFLRMSGEPGNPVVIKNCGGLVEIGDAVTFGRWYAIDLAFSNYVQLTGSGTPGVRYGIKLGKAATALSRSEQALTLRSIISISAMQTSPVFWRKRTTRVTYPLMHPK